MAIELTVRSSTQVASSSHDSEDSTGSTRGISIATVQTPSHPGGAPISFRNHPIDTWDHGPISYIVPMSMTLPASNSHCFSEMVQGLLPLQLYLGYGIRFI